MMMFLMAVLFIMKFIAIASVAVLLGIGADLAYHEHMIYLREKAERAAKAKLLKQKEDEAHEEFFSFMQESYVRGFDSTGALIARGIHRFPTEKAPEYHDRMNKIADEKIFATMEKGL